MAYRGDSPSKKIARIQHWFTVRDILGSNFLREKHLVLASHEGGDISALLGLGVHPGNIVAVDHDPEVIWNLPDKFPEVRGVYGDVFDVARSMGRQLGSAFLDFCGQPHPEILSKIGQLAAHGLRDWAVLSLGFMRGRERGSAKQMLDAERASAAGALKTVLDLPDQSILYFIADVLDRIESVEESVALYASLRDPSTQKLDPARIRTWLAEDSASNTEIGLVVRSLALANNLSEECMKARCFVESHTSIFYTSATDDSRGTPMQILISESTRMTSRDKSSPASAYLASRGYDPRNCVIDPKTSESDVRALAYTMSIGQDEAARECVRRVMNMSEEEFAEALRTGNAVPARRIKLVRPEKKRLDLGPVSLRRA